MDAAQALADLTEISSQIQAAVLAEGEGKVLASTLSDGERAAEMARAAQGLLAAADAVPGGAQGEPLVQLEVATLEGSVFLVRDGDRVIAATTVPEPTVGLVFYDLKSCLRSVAAGGNGDGKTRPRPTSRGQSSQTADAAETEAKKGDGAEDDAAT
jgi:predicted regulator of Ras-like GTPase activity (Roadblock/LC7/MglB family)